MELEFHLKKITELVFASFEFHRVYFFESMELKFTKLEFHFFFFFSFLKIHIKCIWETRFWVGTQEKTIQLTKYFQLHAIHQIFSKKYTVGMHFWILAQGMIGSKPNKPNTMNL